MNRVSLVGRLGTDPKWNPQAGKEGVCNAFLITGSKQEDGQGNVKYDDTCAHTLTIWGARGKAFVDYSAKGDQRWVEGKIRNSSWVDPQGTKHYKSEIVVSDWGFCGKKGDNAGSNDGGYRSQQQSPLDEDRAKKQAAPDDYDIGDLGPPMLMDD